jgi:hypothetical protein
MMKTNPLHAALAAAILVVGCGGGGGDDTPPPAATDAVPASASQSVAGLLSYLVALTRLQPEDKEALDVSAFAPPQPDDSEPQALD